MPGIAEWSMPGIDEWSNGGFVTARLAGAAAERLAGERVPAVGLRCGVLAGPDFRTAGFTGAVFTVGFFLAGAGIDMPGMLIPPIACACASNGTIAAMLAAAAIMPERALMPRLPGGGH